MERDRKEELIRIPQTNQFAILPAYIRYNRVLNHLEKLLYAEITATMDIHNECFYDISHFAKLLCVSDRTIHRGVSKLRELGFIEIVESVSHKTIKIPSVVIKSELNPLEERKKIQKEYEESVQKFSKKIVAEWNNLYGTRLRITPNIMTKVKARMSSFTEEEIMKACRNRFKILADDVWFNKPENFHHKINIDLLLRSDDLLQKWLNLESAAKENKPVVKKTKFE